MRGVRHDVHVHRRCYHLGMHKDAPANSLRSDELDASLVLGEAVLNAGAQLGLSATQVGQVIGRDRSSIGRNGVNPKSKSGELAMLLVRLFRSLYSIVGGQPGHMLHFMRTKNQGTQGVPQEQIYSVDGLVGVVQYLDAMRGLS